jgi:isochorismate pyruvate lyase
MTMADFNNLAEIREKIDILDKKIINLLAERSKCVKEAAKFKTTVEDVKAPDRVEQVITKVRKLAVEDGLDPDIAEETYRTLIKCFIDYETKELG